MTTLFLGGSRTIRELAEPVRRHLAVALQARPAIVVGDAPGADSAFQRALLVAGWAGVTVFCAGGACRNNLGGWPVRVVPTGRRTRDARFFAIKDLAMVQEATEGLMLWDGTSLGTLMNAVRLARQGKPVTLAIPLRRSFETIADQASWREFHARLPPVLRQQLDARDRAERTEAAPVPLPELAF